MKKVLLVGLFCFLPAFSLGQGCSSAAWLGSIDFPTITKTLTAQFPTSDVARILNFRATAWAKESGCTHAKGVIETQDGAKKFDLFVTPVFLELTIHLDIDRDEEFRVQSSGVWDAKKDGQSIHETNVLLRVK